MLLHQPRNRIQVARAGMRAERPPPRRRGPRGLDGGVNIRRRALRNRSQFLSVRRIDGVEVLSSCGRLPSAADEMLEAVAMTTQPRHRFFRIFRSGPVFHAHELFGNAHWRLLDSYFGLVSRVRSYCGRSKLASGEPGVLARPP